jgi:hypothetical protein
MYFKILVFVLALPFLLKVIIYIRVFVAYRQRKQYI